MLGATACSYSASAVEPPTAISSILFLGNSLTVHAPSPNIGWIGNWGMAASEIDKDYAHVLGAQMTGAKYTVLSLSGFEANYRGFDPASLDTYLQPPPDLIVVELGDNVTDGSEFESYYRTLIGHLVGGGHAHVVCASTWFGSSAIDTAIRSVCAPPGATFVDLSGIAADPRNHAASERTFSDAAVGAHPGDRGMALIAAALLAAINQSP